VSSGATSSADVSTTTSFGSNGATTTGSEPAADFERYIHPDEWAVVRQACLRDEGWVVEITVDGGIRFPEVTPEQSVEMEAANDRCGERYPIDPKYREPLTEEQLAFLHTWYLEENIPCMEAEGYTGFEPPSLERFIETWGTVDHWVPVDDITGQLQSAGADALPALYAQCPPGPPVDDLYSG
jgi:hypothetical protein